MPERGAAVQSRGILTALRAAAIVIIATGLNDVVAGALPRYEPLYLYLASVALVVFLDGVLLGAATALIAVAFYGLLFTSRPLQLAPQVVPLAAAFATVVVVGIIRVIVRRARRRRLVHEAPVATIIPVEPALLPPPRFADNHDVLEAIDALRGELRDREAVLERTFLQAREALVDRARVAEEESAHARAQLEALRGEVERLRGALEGARTDMLARDSELAALRAAAGELRRAGEVERTRADGEHALRATAVERLTEVERALQTSRNRIAELEQSLADLAAEQARGEQTAQETIADAATQLAELKITLATIRANEDAAEAELLRLRGHVAEVERGRDGEHAAAQTRIHELEAALAGTRAEKEAASAELATLRAQVTELDRAVEAGRAEVMRVTSEAETRIAGLQQTLGDTHANAAATIAELESLRARMAEVEALLEAERGASQNAAAEGESRIAELQQALAAARAGAEAASAERESLRARVSELESVVAAERKLRAIDAVELTHLSQDHQAALGKAVEERDAARAEAGGLANRVSELERALEAAQHQRSADAEAAAHETDELRARIVALQGTLDSERVGFDQKLNTIATHLAQDHEADLGKAVEEREEARAEARSIAVRITTLQKKYDDERQLAARLLSEMRSAGQYEIDRLRAELAALQAAQQRAVVQSPGVQPAAAPQAVRPRILIAHPDADLRMNARASLERAGYEIVSAADGLEALRTAIAQRPDVVIADAVMPKMDGRELCQLLKSQEKTAHIRVILLLRSTDEPPKGELVPDEVLRKPVPLETLKATLAGLLAAKG